MADTGPRFSDIPAAIALLGRVPVPGATPARADGVWAYPLAGAAFGGLAALVAGLALALGLPPALAAFVTLAALVAMTGALHEDGLADVADGFWGGWTRERRLEIMRDSRIGSYGVAALVLSLGARWQVLALILAAEHGWAALIVAGALSRAAMPALMTVLPPARPDGLSRSVGRPRAAMTGLGAAIAACLALLLLPFQTALAAMLLVFLAALATGALAREKIGGQTGDTLGATQQLAEIAVLFVLAA
ncbi:MAG: adenosylcobinamide-GDP ribazoletransferase [Pseudooceanicola sp.]